jgi:hypothetical protein
MKLDLTVESKRFMKEKARLTDFDKPPIDSISLTSKIFNQVLYKIVILEK